MVKLIKVTNFFDNNSKELIFADNNQTGILISTCNRVEFYYGEGYIEESIVNHLFRVVSGLESNLVGEISIQGQVKESYLEAKNRYSLSKGLHKLFQTSLNIGKKVRSLTNISKGAMSHSQSVIEILKSENIDIRNSNITIIGVNKLNKIILDYINRFGHKTVFLANRTFDKALELSNKYKCKALRLDKLNEVLKDTDILISSTSAPHLILKLESFPLDKSMRIFDLAVPSDIDSQIGNLPFVKLSNIEDVEKRINQNLDKRSDDIKKAEEIIKSEVEKFMIKQAGNK